MEIKERNSIIGIISFLGGIVLMMYIIPILVSFRSFPSIFITPYGFLFFDLFILANTLFLYGCFLIRPIRTLKGKEYLAKGTLIIGGILIILPLIGAGYQIFVYLQYSWLSVLFFLIEIIPFIILLIPGVALFIHGWFLHQKPRTENID